jgi:hypothetical protein
LLDLFTEFFVYGCLYGHMVPGAIDVVSKFQWFLLPRLTDMQVESIVLFAD